ncbi:hypothetical protein NAT51_05360 [Flavobacterium amniphilum]|uniref:hypothetical protein n=1 Tax=Flavobacterium amniphilum TaxID=1834035 RepID=UPI00202A8879|nr:hypothetical protein [Flavobacterium amniphilum]MCL9804934.1 hypothetical protein [Flavobacterium amniphilum]
MKKIYIVTVLFLMSLVVNAQDYKLFGATNGNKVQLKWMSKNLKGNTSFDIFRSESGSSWQKLNSSPIVPSALIAEAELKTPKNPFPKDKSYEFYIQSKNTKATDPNKRAYVNYQLALAAIFDNQTAKHLGIFFEDNAVVSGKRFNYKLVDNQSGKEISVLNGLVAGEIPLAPKNTKAAQEKQNVKMSWETNEDFMGYNVYRDGIKINSEPVMANLEKSGYQSGYTDVNVVQGSHVYTVKGITMLNTESQASAEIKIEVKDATAPVVVKGFKAERKNDEVVLSWLASLDKDLAGYHVLKSTDKGKTFKRINSEIISETKFVEKLDETAFGSFQYQIEAVDRYNNASKTIPANVFVPDHNAPAMPKEVTSKSEPGKITLSWRSNSEKDLAGYRIYRGLKDDDENEMLLLNVNPQIQTAFVDTFNDKAGTKFVYKITAMDKSFNESPQAVVWVQLPDVVAPQAPFLHEAKFENGQLNLKWNAVHTDAILGYDVYQVYEGREMKLNTEPVKEVSFSSVIRERGQLEYYIKAIDSAKLVSKASNKLAVATAEGRMETIRLSASQDVASKKVQLRIDGILPNEVAEVKLFKRKGEAGFVRMPFVFSERGFTDENTELGTIYEYFVEVITIDGVKIKSEKITFNNS